MTAAPDRLDDPAGLEAGDPDGMLPAIASSAAQVREAAVLAAEAGVATLALDGDETLEACSTMRRFCVASGEVFSDALPAAVLAARVRGPLLLTKGRELPVPVRKLLEKRAYRVLDVTLVGGEATLRSSVANNVATLLRERQAK
mgnify:CR=1 FL=1